MSILQHATIEQTTAHEDTSDRYTQISTRHIIDSLEARGFELDGVNIAGVRKASNQGFQKHLVTMKYKELETSEGVPTIIIQNSHNRSSGLKFHTGFIRFACMNGLILGNGITEHKMRHSASWQEKATAFLDNYVNEVARMEREHERMRNQYMSASMIQELAHKAVQIRYKSRNILDSNELVLIKRKADLGNDLYHVYNRIQEALIQGNFQRRIENVVDDKVEYSDWGKANKITSTDETIRINKELRTLVMEMA